MPDVGGGPAAFEEALRLFAVPEVDLGPVRSARAAVCREPALRDWVADTAARLREMGELTAGLSLPRRPLGEPGVTAYLPVLAFAEVLPDLLREHRRRSVPADVTRLTLADVGRMLARNRVWYDEPGLADDLAGWLVRHLCSRLVQLGRLQYERVLLGEGAGLELQLDGFPCAPGDLVLNLHIPAEGGPLTPAVVDTSLAAARAFFRKRFPEERYAVITCDSWMLDPQLLEALPDGSNLAAFQRRFTLDRGGSDEGDVSARKFVFGDVDSPLAELPQDTSLRRAVVRLLERGGHWHGRGGWLAWR